MGCNNVRVLPLPAQRAIKSKRTVQDFMLSTSEFDQNYDWYCNTCQELENSSIRLLTLNFDAQVTLKRTFSSSPIAEVEGQLIDSLFGLLGSLRLNELILTGNLEIFNNVRWKEYWKECKVDTISVQDRMGTKGFVALLKSHAHNTNTKKLILKRDLILNDMFYLFGYLLQNATLEDLQLILVDPVADKSTGLLLPSQANKAQTQILVPADQMELTGILYKPLGVLAENATLKCIVKS
eukprot:TRINITY_DN3796_c0_g4_i2.p1 TRINITY_DN3796_c0_g4~~TRINITY_DN3796_c0_g4_i2.p1  ORF type:complete len:238 (-),score=46.41 TRINITY_DN3796_c0_g4_i2:1260-1973(-)